MNECQTKNRETYYYDDGSIYYFVFYNKKRQFHRKTLPAIKQWYPNGKISNISYYQYGNRHNINNPACIYFEPNEKIGYKGYYMKAEEYTKLEWQNQVKNI